MKRKKSKTVVIETRQSVTICDLPSDVFDVIFGFAGCNFASIASLRLVSRRFNLECGRMLNQGAVRLMNDVVDFMNKSEDGSFHNDSSYPVLIIYLNLWELFDEYSRFVAEGRCCFIPGKVIDEARRLLETNNEVLDMCDKSYWRISLCPKNKSNDRFNRMCSRAKGHFTKEVIPRLQEPALHGVSISNSQEASTKKQKVLRSFFSSSWKETRVAPFIFHHKPSAEPGTLEFLIKWMHVIVKNQDDTIYFQKSKIDDLEESIIMLRKSISSLKILQQEQGKKIVCSNLHAKKENPKNILDLSSKLLCGIFSYVDFEAKSKLRSVCQRFNVECQWMLNEGYEGVRKKHERSVEILKSKLRSKPTEQVLVRKYTHLKDMRCCLEVLYHTYGCSLWENKCCFIAGRVLDNAEKILTLLNNEGQFKETDLIFKLKEMTKKAGRHFELHVSPLISKSQVKGFSFLWHASCRSCWNREWRMSAYELGIKSNCELSFVDAKKPQVTRMLAEIETRDREIDIQDSTITNLFSVNSALRREIYLLKTDI